MLELIVPDAALVWNHPTLTIYFTSEAVVKGLHLAHLKDVKLSKALIGGNYNITVIGPKGNVLIPVPADNLAETETFISQMMDVIMKYRASKK